MQKNLFLFVLLFWAVGLTAQVQPVHNNAVAAPQFFQVKKVEATPVKNQARTGTCWCFSATSLIESEVIRKNKKEINLSEMFTVRNMYIEKAKNYILRQGKAQFGEGGLGHDLVHAIATYGALPLDIYTGLPENQKMYNHQQLFSHLKSYLDSLLQHIPVAADWLTGYTKILDDQLGIPPATFIFQGVKYTPASFAGQVLAFNQNDYINLTSFTHQPYYKPFILQVPDNFANGSFYNIPLHEMIQIVKEALDKGYSVNWDADVSNKGFMQNIGLALNLDNDITYNRDTINADMPEAPYDENIRQQLYENLTTQDDHLMHLTGMEKTKEGKLFFIVKNSWGNAGPCNGYINVSEAYFAINTISLVIPKEALPEELLVKLGVK